ncbi:hypothetical protein A2422_00200 [Candidatus Woesebacteria bacterium RIFOXYC1_FULL_31_51]|uniref:LAGLIDADG homing endonuclease n=1 Tax=Candidatus Woesebacteria bacterium GW2011_GWC2_31_9 TaxID=1618586 RepID=A0A0G0BKT1_9BACT|nr:MAG: LAGLIDADG homing endonuclease [Candidatus Woesebacteria bacterium GW2011_GWF1_31_35]KKP31637.1 MAG: LAGLIDADG homing endonuclease [Candidatus Woesebacteria bacterium GW2011_GWC2_31_9]KKP73693.1 MAG: LAGLIDADG homing endonuclease [Candidatus Woesebacteria bacterium GW2011_GWE1_35_20]OGM73288.1 MAG: hypothetical protein A2185_01735 [Candidatus Woesebacteria bacterium RIFOXYA1_FULL_31_71]OGM78538.1 MAG: hypothetical protein A2375_03850 [Candidatus Woesebacteria bacterium RIFOXYB1_FULL_31_1
MASKNDLGRENQQERLKTIGWIVGFVDGEGCFSVSVFKNKTTKNGWQIFPEFVVTQSERSISTLQEIKKFFGCGNIFVNHRYDNHNENLYRYCVRNIHDLKDKIIPFFESNNLRSAKIKDLNIFKEVVLLMINKKHLQKEGFDKILSIAGKRKI